MKRKVGLCKWMAAVVLVLTAAASVVLAKGNLFVVQAKSDDIAWVNEIPISVVEFNKALRKNRAYSGESPTDVWKQKALDDSVSIKMQQIIAQENGVWPDISYSSFLQQWKRENERRQQAIRNKQVVFGPTQYSEDGYFEYMLSNANLAVKKQMQEQEAELADGLKAFYERKKDSLYASPGSVKVQQVMLTFLDANHQVSSKDKKRQEMEEVKAKLSSGADLEEAAKAYMPEGTVSVQQFAANNVRQNLRSPAAQAALKLKQGEISDVIEENGSYILMKCMEKSEPGFAYTPFEEIKEQILKDYIDDKYKEELQTRISQARIKVNDRLYQAVKVGE
ncbi:peptidyl-prolyl cis-trans isomerase [Paenibacillus sp. HWE-109]|uniref:peptidylprolyl isomerase n=1 Tax=Paenibacillus sp. HWE-109 TaxID=1306526 RepID=UPI001EDCED98|nr:peptidyl-prolyl cis-trans isomerase [Paenibacillus sp. HWE-109]UKS24783.1 peptidyl-prolyl cis-trans isomerase [Paenibacillus sp. HWE-109]